MSPVASISGFPELLPAEKIVEDQVIDTLRRVFELHGFTHLETRAVETLDELQRKGETSKEVYVLSRLQDKEGTGKSKLGLHFDLTVPLARYVLENSHHLKFPFLRYQIQKVWRGERPQEGRFREFVQADIDMVAQDELPAHYEIDLPLVMGKALSQLPIGGITIHVNSRKVLQGACQALGINDVDAVLTVVDKRDKVGQEVFLQMLAELGLSTVQGEKLSELATINGRLEAITQVRQLGLDSELLEEGLQDITKLLQTAQQRQVDNVIADFKIARGLDYYTGMVYETFLDDAPQVGSICSGGRYDNLVSDKKRRFPGVGMSIGVSRLISVLLSRHALTVTRSVPTAVLVTVTSEQSRSDSDAIATALRARGIPTEVCPNSQKFGKQIKYASMRGIPYVWFTDSSTVKNLETGEQLDATPENWAPDPQHLRPKVKASND